METEYSASDVEQKVGRNVILFQKFEGLLKFMLSRQYYEGAYSEISSIIEARREAVEMQTLGNLAKRYAYDIHKPEPEHQGEPDATPVDGPDFSFSFQVNSDPEYAEKRARELADLVFERNNLIHKVFSSYDESDSRQRAQIAEYLDRQHQHINAEYQVALQLVNAMRDALEHGLQLMLEDMEKSRQ